MTTSKDLMLAILAMDSYNREYGAGLVVSGTQIGSATFQPHDFQNRVSEDTYAAWKSSGFYAAAYTVADGSIVISYRGSDDAHDYWNDFQFSALGPTGVIPKQVELAAQFYQSVKAANPDKTIVLTGHSLGGALAATAAPAPTHARN